MSIWTHINGQFRLEPPRGIPPSVYTEIDLGPQSPYAVSTPANNWSEYDWLPYGSEGTLHYSWTEFLQYSDRSPAKNLHIWGDLRGYEQDKKAAFDDWLDDVLTLINGANWHLRQAIVQYQLEQPEEHWVYYYDEKTEKFISQLMPNHAA